jgi:cell pole-organizing protein PopZ
MSEQAAQEPTMEEILASIRRIISEDDAPAADGQPAAAAPEPATAEATPEPAPAMQPDPEPAAAMADEAPVEPVEEEVLELTEKVEEPAPIDSIGDLDIAPRAEAPAPEPVAVQSEEAPAFIAPTPQYQYTPNPSAGGMTIEDLVRSMLEPKIREWADENLESIMRDIVREKLDRVFK